MLKKMLVVLLACSLQTQAETDEINMQNVEGSLQELPQGEHRSCCGKCKNFCCICTDCANITTATISKATITSLAVKGSLTVGGVSVKSAITNYANFFALMPADNAAPIAVGSAVLFPQNGPSSGSITRLTSSTFQLGAVGTYEVTWQVSITELGQLQLALNGVGLANTVVGRTVGLSQIVGSTLITTTSANSVLSVINPVGNIAPLTVTASAGGAQPVSATLTIKQVA